MCSAVPAPFPFSSSLDLDLPYHTIPYHTMPSLLYLPPIHTMQFSPSYPILLHLTRSHGTARTPFRPYHRSFLKASYLSFRSDPMPSFLILFKPSHTHTNTLSHSPSFFFSLGFLSSFSLSPSSFLSLSLPLPLPSSLAISLSSFSLLSSPLPPPHPLLSPLPSFTLTLFTLLYSRAFFTTYTNYSITHTSFAKMHTIVLSFPPHDSTPHHSRRPSHPLPPMPISMPIFDRSIYGSDKICSGLMRRLIN